MMKSSSTSEKSNGAARGARVVVYAESGLLAGDLAAWLSGSFRVERTTSLAGTRLALSQGAAALIIIGAEVITAGGGISQLVEQGEGAGCRLILLGAEPGDCPAAWREKAVFLGALPEPAQVIAALQDLPPMAAQAES